MYIKKIALDFVSNFLLCVLCYRADSSSLGYDQSLHLIIPTMWSSYDVFRFKKHYHFV